MNKLPIAKCDSCEILVINGIPCHETGCHNSWKHEIRECGCCGGEFNPQYQEQVFCDDSCAESYYN